MFPQCSTWVVLNSPCIGTQEWTHGMYQELAVPKPGTASYPLICETLDVLSIVWGMWTPLGPRARCPMPYLTWRRLRGHSSFGFACTGWTGLILGRCPSWTIEGIGCWSTSWITLGIWSRPESNCGGLSVRGALLLYSRLKESILVVSIYSKL